MKKKLIKLLRFLKRPSCRHEYRKEDEYIHYDTKSVWILYYDCKHCDKRIVVRQEGYSVKTILGLFTEIKKI